MGVLISAYICGQECIGHVGGSGFDGGHLIATHLGGAGDGVNMVPMTRYLNRVEYQAMERQLGEALEAGSNVQIAIRIEYPPIISIPKRLVVETWVDGVPEIFDFKQ